MEAFPGFVTLFKQSHRNRGGDDCLLHTRLIRVSDHMSKDGQNSYTICNAKHQTGYSNHFQTTPSLHPTQSSLSQAKCLICLMTFCHNGFELRKSILMEYNRVKKATTMYILLIPSLHLPIAHNPHSFHNTEPAVPTPPTRIAVTHTRQPLPVHQATHLRAPTRRLTTTPRLHSPYRHHPY
jgi:hypothetical protein